MRRKRVVVTGVDVLSPNGVGIDTFWPALLGGKSGIDRITNFDVDDCPVKIAGEIKEFDVSSVLSPTLYRKMDRFAQLGVSVAKLAVRNSGLTIDASNERRMGVVCGTGLGGLLFHEEQLMSYLQSADTGSRRVMASCVPKVSPNSVSAYIAMNLHVKGINYALSTACSSGTNAIGQGYRMIREGLLDACIVVGVEAPISPFALTAYSNLQCLSLRNEFPQEASSPFDKDRDGFVLSEGAAALVLESSDFAKNRHANVLSEIVGFGSNCGAYNMVAPQPDGLDAAHAMLEALEDANLHVGNIDYINAHGTGTQPNDLAETKAIKYVFKEKAYEIPISSTKSMTGHAIGAAGAIEAVVCVMTIKNQTIHPTINLKTPDPQCDLDYVAEGARKQSISYTMSNSFGFGSNNAVIIFSGNI